MDPKIELPIDQDEVDVARARLSFTEAYVTELRINRELAPDIRTMRSLDGT